jgi:hypothetical protein
MRILLASLMASLLFALPARAQLQVEITLGLPVVLPPLVVVQPGVEVVSDLDEEVYFVDGWYWVRRGTSWYRTHDHRGRWAWVAPVRVPVALVRIPPGQYRRFYGEEAKEERGERREREKEERREWKNREKAERKQWKDREKAEHAMWKEGKHKGRDRHNEDD